MTSDDLPGRLGYRWPAEWEPHDATWLAWPHNRETWRTNYDAIPARFARFVEVLAAHERVNVLAGGTEAMQDARDWIGQVSNVQLVPIQTNDAWIRDYGPMFLKLGGSVSGFVDWRFNSWGGKYPPWSRDNAVAGQLGNRLQLRRFPSGFVLEGGAIDGNGRGTVLTTESCLLNPNRNGSITRAQVEHQLAKMIGCRCLIWLTGRGVEGDDTDGHVDQLARFVGPRHVVAAVSQDKSDRNYDALQENVDRLSSARDCDGRALEVLRLPLPDPQYAVDQRLPASYCNFYVANGLVVVPQFADDADAEAVRVLAGCFPDRMIVGLPALDLTWGLGAFHCLTQQQPHGEANVAEEP